MGTKFNSFTLCGSFPSGDEFETSLFVANRSLVISQVCIGPGLGTGEAEHSRICVNINEGGADVPDILRKLADQLELDDA